MKNINIVHALMASTTKLDTQEKIDTIMKIEGSMRGELLRNNFIYLQKKEGEEAVERMEKKLEKLGYPLYYKKINPSSWYKDSFCAVFMISFNEEFNWTMEDIFNLGRFSPQYSMIIKVALRHILTTKKAFDFGPNLWRRNVDYGYLEPYEFNEKEKFLIFRLRDYALHPFVCIYIRGYLTSLFEQIIGRNKVTVEEISCIFKGSEYHEYKISWE